MQLCRILLKSCTGLCWGWDWNEKTLYFHSLLNGIAKFLFLGGPHILVLSDYVREVLGTALHRHTNGLRAGKRGAASFRAEPGYTRRTSVISPGLSLLVLCQALWPLVAWSTAKSLLVWLWQLLTALISILSYSGDWICMIPPCSPMQSISIILLHWRAQHCYWADHCLESFYPGSWHGGYLMDHSQESYMVTVTTANITMLQF